MKTCLSLILCVLLLTAAGTSKTLETAVNLTVNFDSPVIISPMGWNNRDCLGLDANDEHIKAIAYYMAANLKQCGWEYVVIDASFHHPKELITADVEPNGYRLFKISMIS